MARRPTTGSYSAPAPRWVRWAVALIRLWIVAVLATVAAHVLLRTALLARATLEAIPAGAD